MNKVGKFYGIGVGPGDPELLTIRAVKVIQSVDVIYDVSSKMTKTSISGFVVDSVESCKAERKQLIFSMSLDAEVRSDAHKKGALEVVADLKAGKDCAFATIGDPLIYSTYVYLLREIQKHIPELEVETIPGITSFQAAAAKNTFTIVEDTEKLCLVPAFSEEIFKDCDAVKDADTLVMLKTYKTRNSIPKFLKENGFSTKGLYASRIGSNEELFESDLDSISDLPQEYLSLIIAKKNK